MMGQLISAGSDAIGGRFTLKFGLPTSLPASSLIDPIVRATGATLHLSQASSSAMPVNVMRKGGIQRTNTVSPLCMTGSGHHLALRGNPKW